MTVLRPLLPSLPLLLLLLLPFLLAPAGQAAGRGTWGSEAPLGRCQWPARCPAVWEGRRASWQGGDSGPCRCLREV